MTANDSSPAAAPSGEVDPGLGYEEARDQLADVVRQLEAGGLTLEESLALWERGEQLAQLCQKRLDGVRTRIEQVVAARDTGGGQAEQPDD